MDARAFMRADAFGGLAQLKGMRLTGEIPLREGVINDALRSRASASDLMVTIEDRNRIVLRKGLFSATATLDETVDIGHTPKIRLRLASVVIAWTLGRLVRLPYLTIDGRIVTIDVGGLPPVRGWEPVLRHLRRAALTTTRGVLQVQFEWYVEPDPPRG
jgi:hypothetical protein